MEQLQIKSLYNLEETLAASLFDGAVYPWELLPKIGAYIIALGETLSTDKYEKCGENIWIAKSATVAPTAYINDRVLLMKMQKFVIAHLLGEMPLLEKALLSVILQN